MKKQTLQEVTEDSPCHWQDWCFLKDYFLHLGSDRTAMQIRIMVDYRYILGKKLGREVTDKEAFDSYVSDGYSKSFSDIYDINPQISHRELKRKLFNDE